ncbi:hypothetical protein HAX54_032852 [Datura stramonium]|uniref:Uncharacterized protein n=1 Tax=Datura stramonium TaxID=4076 RepID=A0ABS8VCY7_DATST|nr:hypothetical protein [Datura stramonium]
MRLLFTEASSSRSEYGLVRCTFFLVRTGVEESLSMWEEKGRFMVVEWPMAAENGGDGTAALLPPAKRGRKEGHGVSSEKMRENGEVRPCSGGAVSFEKKEFH